MRVTVQIDSANAKEAEDFVRSYQRTIPDRGLDWKEPTVRLMGIGWGVTTPPIPQGQAVDMMRELVDAFDVPDESAVDPLDQSCPQCGAEPKEPCFPGCLSVAAEKAAASCPSDCEDCAAQTPSCPHTNERLRGDSLIECKDCGHVFPPVATRRNG